MAKLLIDGAKEARSKCPFCTFAYSSIMDQNASAIAIRDDFPVTHGHTLVVPRQHVSSIFELAHAEYTRLWKLVFKIRITLALHFSPAGFNIGINDGQAAGQTIPHAHIHIIPRYEGDVTDPRGGVRWIIPDKAVYWENPS